MRIAITGGSGFIGGTLAHTLLAQGHEVVLLARRTRTTTVRTHPNVQVVSSDPSDVQVLLNAFSECEAVAHCAGINREIGNQTYQRVHLQGTRNVIEAATKAGVRKILLMSFLRARPGCGSAYHQSKWEAEEVVRNARLDYTIFKAGMVYGRGDHMLDHLSHAFYTLPLLPTVGLREKRIRPLAIQDLVRTMAAALSDGRFSRKTIAITGAEELYLSDAARRVARVLGKKIIVFAAPVCFQYVTAQIFEGTMKIPLAAKAQVRILSEGVVEPALPCDCVPEDLAPILKFTEQQIRSGLPEPGPFTVQDPRCCFNHA